jgi:hypothetical protein
MMKNFIIISILIFSFINVSKAQFLQSGIAVTAVTPVGNFSDRVNTGYGGVFMAKFGLPAIDITGSVEYLKFSEKETTNTKVSSTMWSVNAGARISIFPFISAGAELGNYWITVTTENGEKKDEKINKVAFSPLIAASISIVEASLRYSIISDASFLSLRAGIYF